MQHASFRSFAPLLRVAALALAIPYATLGCNRGKASAATASGGAAATASASATPAVEDPLPPQAIAPAEMTAPATAQKTPSGLATKVLRRGSGTTHPDEWDVIRFHVTGWSKTGTTFINSSAGEGAKPVVLRVRDSAIDGWVEGVQQMVEGESRRMWIPGSLGFVGRAPMATTPEGDLVMDVELVQIVKAVKPPPAPEDVAGPPAKAKRTPSGLAYKPLASPNPKGTKPLKDSVVSFHYTTWAPNGTVIASSLPDGAPETTELGSLGPGWGEVLSLMKVGDKVRFWSPHDKTDPTPFACDIELVYVARPGALASK